MQTSIQKPESIRFGSGRLDVYSVSAGQWINLGAIKEGKVTVTKSLVELVTDNTKATPKVKINEAILSANLYEVALDKMQLIDGMADYITVDGTPVTVTGEEVGTAIIAGVPFSLDHKNGDNTLATSIEIKKDGTALVLNTDYRVFLDGGQTRILPIVSHTGTITADYVYTPLASRQQIYKDVQKSLAMNRFRFVNTNADGKEFGVEIYQGYNAAGIEATFQPDSSTDDALSIPIEIKAFPVAVSNNMFRIFDEQDVL